MPQTLDQQIYAVSFAATITNPLDLQTATAPLAPFNQSYGWSSGVLAGQADRIFADTRTINASSSETLDLAGGGLVDAVGTAFNPARVKAIAVRANANNANNVVVGGIANSIAGILSPAATGTITIQPGGLWVIVAPGAVAYPVVAGTGDLIQVANSGAGTSVTYDIVIVGASA